MGKVDANHAYYESPSTRRAWIEMRMLSASGVTTGTSPSTRRAWIEIYGATLENGMVAESPSTRRAWIEITRQKAKPCKYACRPPPGGRG